MAGLVAEIGGGRAAEGDDVGLVDVGPTFLSIVVASGEMLVGASFGGVAADPIAGGAMPTTVIRLGATGLFAPVAPGFADGMATGARGLKRDVCDEGGDGWLSSFAIARLICGSGAC